MSAERNTVKIIFLGHAKSGKSTLIRYLIFNYGTLDKSVFENLEKEESDLENSGSKYSWILKKLINELDYGYSTDLSLWRFRSARNTISIVNAQGHINFLKSMITGQIHVDIAILVDSTGREEFNVHMSQEHAELALTLGIKNIIIVINKLDTINYDEKRFHEYSDKIKHHISKVGYDPEKVHLIPISAENGVNILKLSPHTSWYKGPTLLQCIDILHNPINLTDKPLRFSAKNLMSVEGENCLLLGKIESGIMKTSMDVSISPSGISSKVVLIKDNSTTINEAKAGDEIGILVKSVSPNDIVIGSVVGDLNNPPKPAIDFTALIYILDHPDEICTGYVSILECHNARISFKIAEIIEKIDPQSGHITERNPCKVKTGDAALVKILPLNPICVESYSQFPYLGRFFIPYGNCTSIFGIIKCVKFKEHKSKSSFSERIRERFSSK